MMLYDICIYVHEVSPRVQSYIISLYDYVMKTISLSIHIYVYTYIHLYICIQIYTCIHTSKYIHRQIKASESRVVRGCSRDCTVFACAQVWSMHLYVCKTTGWQRPIVCLIFIGHFPQQGPIITGSFAKRDMQIKAPHASLLPCNRYIACDTYV